MWYMLVSCHLHVGFMATCLVNFPKFDNFLPHFLYGQIFLAEESPKQKDS